MTEGTKTAIRDNLRQKIIKVMSDMMVDLICEDYEGFYELLDDELLEHTDNLLEVACEED